MQYEKRKAQITNTQKPESEVRQMLKRCKKAEYAIAVHATYGDIYATRGKQSTKVKNGVKGEL